MAIAGACNRLPDLVGEPISVSVGPQLTASGGKLLYGHPTKGTAVYAAAFIRERRIVLESTLRPRKLRLILTHEVFHFVWARLGNALRCAFAALLHKELQEGARGELGESAGIKKQKLASGKCQKAMGRIWRDYVCESFCDTAAWLYSGCVQAPEYQLATRWKALRRGWFHSVFEQSRAC